MLVCEEVHRMQCRLQPGGGELCIGLADNQIQEDLLKDPNQDMSVEEMIRFIEVRASGEKSAASLTTPTSANELGDGEGNEAIGSAYRRQQ